MFIEPKVSEMEERYISQISTIRETDIYVNCSNCHYTKEFLMERILRPHTCTHHIRQPNEETIISNKITVYNPLSTSKLFSAIDKGSLEEMKVIALVPCLIHTN
ncbi:hypothetical protein LOD99_8451 [Oopsacas minuta]|uniref:Uncharacterized protein n=1 Tax=Oopsacas minuta TaxID=111878 RepID=A0AAV7JGC8_9METZ|nr:hypothetical protein LOD99_8451 [Oopsacas minuta]